MSSHHVVRDKQEPALIIANGMECSKELLGQLLEWSPFTVVLDGAWPRVHAMGMSVDAILGDFDGKWDIEAVKNERPEIQLIQTPDPNFTDLQKAVQWLIGLGHGAVNIVWASGLRMDHSFNNVLSMAGFAGQINWRIIDDNSLVYAVPRDFKKHFNSGDIISLFGVPVAEGVCSKNLKYVLDNIQLQIPQSGSSNEVAETGIVHITYKSGTLLLMECHD